MVDTTLDNVYWEDGSDKTVLCLKKDLPGKYMFFFIFSFSFFNLISLSLFSLKDVLGPDLWKMEGKLRSWIS